MPDSARISGVSSLEAGDRAASVDSESGRDPNGPIAPNPADLLSSHKIGGSASAIANEYKFIVIDSPPIMAATDAVILSVQTEEF